jgi:RIO kinase 1
VFEENPPVRLHDFEDDFLDDESAYDNRRSRPRKPKRGEKDAGDRAVASFGEFEEVFDPQSTRSGRLTEQERARLAAVRESAYADPPLPPGADRWSTWGDGEQGPDPRPDWVVTELAAADSELGILKTGKEADVFLLQRAVPDTNRGCLMAAKRYRSNEHRMFHRDAGYLEGRRMRRSREMRAMVNRTSFGRNLIAEQWAVAEFAALSRLWSVGAPVPYPVQRSGTELLMEYLGDDDGAAAPRLAELRPGPDELRDLWHQLVSVLDLLASEGVDRPAADRGPGGQPERPGVPGTRRRERVDLVPLPRPPGRRSGPQSVDGGVGDSGGHGLTEPT